MTMQNRRNTAEVQICDLVERWARAVRDKDIDGILANHSADILMFDVPPPLEAKGIDAYRKTWDAFFAWSDDPVIFAIKDIHVAAGADVAFVAALMRCAGVENGTRSALDFRLTIGLRKIGRQWVVVHEHHSIPAA
jgi:ketosteroid isomerase-like protein